MENKREGRCSDVYFGNVCAERICKRVTTVQLQNAFRCKVLIDRKIFN